MYEQPGVTNASTETYGAGFFQDLLASGPGMSVVISGETGKIIYTSKNLPEMQVGAVFFELLSEADRARFLHQLKTVTSGINNQFGIYKLDVGHPAMYIYASYIHSQTQGEDYFHLYLLPERSQQTVPFLSFNSRELFLEQTKQLSSGTFEWLIEPDIVYWSEGVYDIYEVDKSEQPITSEMARKFTHPEDVKKARASVQRALEDGGDFNVEIRVITSSQKIKVINTAGRVVNGEDGKPVKLIGSVRDVTHERQMEDELQKKVSELNRSNKELEEFAYVASHDLQEPLRKITTFCGRLADKYSDVLTGDGAMYMGRVVASAENMRALINNLLEFSRITRDKQPFEEVSLSFVLHQVKSDLELVIEETGAEIHAANLPAISGSLTQMKQLFCNIINNAIKFRKEGTQPVIEIQHYRVNDDEKLSLSLPLAQQYEKITIADNGIGFENEYAERIFQIFQRLHGKSEYPGSGIGLAICKKIIEHHKGLIYAEGAEGKGATFVFILPALTIK